MIDNIKIYGVVLLCISLFSYYKYTQYILDKQEREIRKLEVESEVSKETAKSKDTQHKINTIKEVHNAKDITEDINVTIGSHSIDFD